MWGSKYCELDALATVNKSHALSCEQRMYQLLATQDWVPLSHSELILFLRVKQFVANLVKQSGKYEDNPGEVAEEVFCGAVDGHKQ